VKIRPLRPREDGISAKLLPGEVASDGNCTPLMALGSSATGVAVPAAPPGAAVVAFNVRTAPGTVRPLAVFGGGAPSVSV
jgi:hypothetical protein